MLEVDILNVIPNHHRLADVLSGKAPGRESTDERNYYINNGAGVQYAATVVLVYDRAKKRGIGQEMPAEWFKWFQRCGGHSPALTLQIPQVLQTLHDDGKLLLGSLLRGVNCYLGVYRGLP